MLQLFMTATYYSHSLHANVFNYIQAYFHLYKNTLIKYQNIRIDALQNKVPWCVIGHGSVLLKLLNCNPNFFLFFVF